MLNDQIERIKAVFIDYTPSLFYAAIILLIGVVASKLAKRWLRAILNRSRIRDDLLLKEFFLRVVSGSILLLVYCVKQTITYAAWREHVSLSLRCRWPWRSTRTV